jgi:type II secretory ATPase GspE/PulE/Tfp pilus assembly ATPase PilB-like protein
VRFYRPVGCLECRMTGYLGRVGLYEILLLSQDIKLAISENKDIAKMPPKYSRSPRRSNNTVHQRIFVFMRE